MCGIFGVVARRDSRGDGMGRTVMTMLEALACRGPDSAGAAVIRSNGSSDDGSWSVRIAADSEGPLSQLTGLGDVVGSSERRGVRCTLVSGRHPE